MGYSVIYCLVCTGSKFSSEKARTDHLSSPNHTEVYHCDNGNCGKYFRDRKAFFEHINSHYDDPVHRCNECNRSFADPEALAQHRSDSPRHASQQNPPQPRPTSHISPAHIKFRCEKCDKCFINQQSLTQHSSAAHTHVTYPRCTKCDKEFVDQYALDQHVVSPAHKLKFYCHECDRGFPTYDVLRQHHSLAHPVQEYRGTCERCKKEFNTQRDLDMHLKYSGHAIVANCCVCDENFESRESFEIHMLSHSFAQQVRVGGKRGVRTIETNDSEVWKHLKRGRDEHARLNGCRPVNLGTWARERVGDEKRDSFHLVRPEKKKGEEGYIWRVIED